MQRKNASKGKSAGLSRLEKVVVRAKAATHYRGPVTRRQGLRSSKFEVELPTKLSKDDTSDGDCVPCEEELKDEPGDAEVNFNDGVSSICRDPEEEGKHSFVTAAEPEKTAATFSPIQDEEWVEIVRRGKEREKEESAEKEEERQRTLQKEEKARFKNQKEEKIRQQLAKEYEKAPAKQEKKEEEARLKKKSTLKRQQQEEEARKKAGLAAEAARRQESMEQKRREEVHEALVKSHQKIAEEMVENAKATTRKKEQIAADMAIDLRRRLDLARGLPSSG